MKAQCHNDISLSLVIPVFNEEKNIELLLQKINTDLQHYEKNWELILVDDGSFDQTCKILRNNTDRNIRIVLLRRNFGQSCAIQAGIDRAKGEFIVTMDGDLQNDSQDILPMLKELQENDLDMLCGWRKGRKDSIPRKIVSGAANWLIGILLPVKLHDYGCTLKIFRASIIKKVKLYGEMHRFIPAWVAMITNPNRIKEIIVTHHPRQFGKSKYGMSRIFRVLPDLVLMMFFTKYKGRPIHFFSIFTFFVCGVNLLLLLLSLYLQSYFWLIAFLVLFIVPCGFLLLGVVAEMIIRENHFFTKSYDVKFDSTTDV